MKSKTTLTLIEQLLMLLFFAAAAAICLRIFVYSSGVSEDNRRLSAAVSLAETAAELWSEGDGSDAAAALWGGTVRNGVYTAEPDGLTLTVTPQDSGAALLGAAEVRVYDGETLLLTLPVRWQLP